jgi:hypothetical protein
VPIPATFVLSGSAGRGERPIRNVSSFSRSLNFAKEFVYSWVQTVYTIFTFSIQLCLSCDRQFMRIMRQDGLRRLSRRSAASWPESTGSVSHAAYAGATGSDHKIVTGRLG